MRTASSARLAVPLVALHNPYGRLYQAVILRAVQDLVQKRHRNNARRWLLSTESDYAFAIAGMNPHSIRSQMI